MDSPSFRLLTPRPPSPQINSVLMPKQHPPSPRSSLYFHILPLHSLPSPPTPALPCPTFPNPAPPKPLPSLCLQNFKTCQPHPILANIYTYITKICHPFRSMNGFNWIYCGGWEVFGRCFIS